MTPPTSTPTLRDASCADDYDPNSMPVDKARALITRFLTPLTATERVPVRSALGRVLAEDVISPINVPAHDNSAMDGYAVRFADLKSAVDVSLTVVGSSFAGKPYVGKMQADEAVRIMTGAVMPPEADTIVMQEHAQVENGHVTIGIGHRKNQNLRRAGEDLAIGQVALKRGLPLRPAEIGLISSIGIGEVTVFRKLRVAFFSTGDELVSIGSIPGEGQIFDSNRYTIHGMLTRLNCEVIDMGVVRDDPALIEAAFATAAANADVVITSGGVSVGRSRFCARHAEQTRRSAVLENRHETGPPAGLRQNRRRAFLRPARQPGVGDGDLLPIRARRAAGARWTKPGAAAAHLQSVLQLGAEKSARPYRVSARHFVAGRSGRVERARHRRTGVGHPAFNERG